MNTNTVNIVVDTSELVKQDKANVTLKIIVTGKDRLDIQKILKNHSVALFKKLKSYKKIESYSIGQNISDVHDYESEQRTFLHYRGEFSIGLITYDFEALNISINELIEQKDIPVEIAGSEFSVSFKLKQEKEEALTKDAIQAFQKKAQVVAESFGFSGYSLGSIDISSSQKHYSLSNSLAGTMMSNYSGASNNSEMSFLEPHQERVLVSIKGSIILNKNII